MLSSLYMYMVVE